MNVIIFTPQEIIEYLYIYQNILNHFLTDQIHIVTPPSLMETCDFFKKIKSYGKDILTVEDILENFKPKKPVICIYHYNGKTTTTTLLKRVSQKVR